MVEQLDLPLPTRRKARRKAKRPTRRAVGWSWCCVDCRRALPSPPDGWELLPLGVRCPECAQRKKG